MNERTTAAELCPNLQRIVEGETFKNVYLTGPIQLKSHVYLAVNAGVTLLATTDQGQYSIAYLNYPMPGTNVFPFLPTAPYEALVFAYQAVDTGIIGTGVIIGGTGLAYRHGWAGCAYPCGLGLGTLLTGLLFAHTRRYGFMTLSEEIACYYEGNRAVVHHCSVFLQQPGQVEADHPEHG